MSLENAFAELLKSGPIGAIAIIAILYAWQKDKQYTALSERAHALMEGVIAGYKGLVQELTQTVNKLQDANRQLPGAADSEENNDER